MPQPPDTGTTSSADAARDGGSVSPSGDRNARTGLGPSLSLLGGVPVALLAAAATAYLGASGQWFIAAGVIGAIPLGLLIHRQPLAAVMIWMAVMPFLVDDAGGGLRKVFWLVHRILPLATLIMILVARRLGFRVRPLPRLGWPELAMATYVVLTLFSVLYSSESDRAIYELYDRVVVPMLLYLIVRLEEPDVRELRRFVPVVAFILLTQSLFGALAWVAPGLLPNEWLDRAGTRTTGSLRSVAVFGATMVFVGLSMLHGGWYARRRSQRMLFMAGTLLAGVMIFMTFSRASWLAGLVALGGATLVYRGLFRRLLFFVVPLLALALAMGVAGDMVTYANARFLSEGSERSALGRLPVAYAAVNMFEERPLWGFGYGNFEIYDREYQEAIPGLVIPEKDLASHNLYLTVLAEQGLPGFLSFVGPAVVWLALFIPAFRRLPRDGLWSRQLLMVLWLIVASFVIVNNFSNMKIPFGLGLWWLALGQIAVVTSKALRPEPFRSHRTTSTIGRVAAQLPSPASLNRVRGAGQSR